MRSQINKPLIHLKLLEKQEQAKPQTSRWKEVIQSRAEIKEIKEIETQKTIQR
jgi:hypothetical protein